MSSPNSPLFLISWFASSIQRRSYYRHDSRRKKKIKTNDRLAVINTLISLPNFSWYTGFELLSIQGDAPTILCCKIKGDRFTALSVWSFIQNFQRPGRRWDGISSSILVGAFLGFWDHTLGSTFRHRSSGASATFARLKYNLEILKQQILCHDGTWRLGVRTLLGRYQSEGFGQEKHYIVCSKVRRFSLLR